MSAHCPWKYPAGNYKKKNKLDLGKRSELYVLGRIFTDTADKVLGMNETAKKATFSER